MALPDSQVQITSGESLPHGSLASLLTEAFTDYVAGPVQMDEVTARRFLDAGGVDPRTSLVAMAGELPVGFALLGHKGGHARLASMGVIPGWRCRGVGHTLLHQLIADAKARRETSLELEVFERNLPAVALYEHAGFRLCRRLLGWKRDAATTPGETDAAGTEELTREQYLALPGADFPELPWQLSREGAARLAPEARYFKAGAAAVGVIGLETPKPFLRCVNADPETASGDLSGLLQGLAGLFPGHTWKAPAYWPEEYAPAFRSASFVQYELNQLQMSLDLRA